MLTYLLKCHEKMFLILFAHYLTNGNLNFTLITKVVRIFQLGQFALIVGIQFLLVEDQRTIMNSISLKEEIHVVCKQTIAKEQYLHAADCIFFLLVCH